MEPLLPERFPAPATLAGRYSILVKLRFAQKPYRRSAGVWRIGPALYSLDPISCLNPRSSVLSSLRSAFASVVYRPVCGRRHLGASRARVLVAQFMASGCPRFSWTPVAGLSVTSSGARPERSSA